MTSRIFQNFSCYLPSFHRIWYKKIFHLYNPAWQRIIETKDNALAVPLYFMINIHSSAQLMPIPLTGDFRHDLLSFSQKLQDEFTTFLILFRIIQQLSEINLWILFLFIAFHIKSFMKFFNHAIQQLSYPFSREFYSLIE